MSELDRVHARIMLTELLRDTAPPASSWGDGLLLDAIDLAFEVWSGLCREQQYRQYRAGEGGSLEKS